MSDTELTKGSVSGWIAKMRQGDPVAIEKLVARYFKKIANFANKRLRRGIRVLDDGEDIAISVLQSITSNSAKGRFPNLQDRDDLWLMMIMIAQHDVIDKQRAAVRRDRLSESTLTMTDLLETYNINLDLFLSQKDSHTKLMEIAECWEDLLKTLPDERCRDIAQLKIKGHSNLEIAGLLGLIPKTVDRKIKLIMQRWNYCFSKYFDC